jgi:shikimate 5-dehydrogenase
MSQAIQAGADTQYPKATRPTLYFIGVTTGRSSIMTVFPGWAEYLGLGDAVIRGIDCKWHDDPAVYRRAVEHLRADDLSLGALVTTHKIDLLRACRDLFDDLDPYAQQMGEISCISKRDGRLVGHAKDPITSGLALEAFLPAGHWERTGGEALVLGAGGSSIAVTSYLMDPRHGPNRPSQILVTNRSTPRLDEIHRIHQKGVRSILSERPASDLRSVPGLAQNAPDPFFRCVHTPRAEDNDVLLSALKPHSLVINATGLGKDAPGSPITAAARFPEHGYAWDFNYRGELVFLDQARAQQKARNLTIEDGWVYFLHGWTQVIAEVFHVSVPVRGPVFEELSRIAAGARR